MKNEESIKCPDCGIVIYKNSSALGLHNCVSELKSQLNSIIDAGVIADEKQEQRDGVIVGSEALAKSLMDPFDYALKLRTGEIVRYHKARLINDQWIHLEIKGFEDNEPHKDGLPYPAERGVDVRLEDIVWVMDAPSGS